MRRHQQQFLHLSLGQVESQVDEALAAVQV